MRLFGSVGYECSLPIQLDLLSSSHLICFVVQGLDHLASLSGGHEIRSEGVVELAGLHTPAVFFGVNYRGRHCGWCGFAQVRAIDEAEKTHKFNWEGNGCDKLDSLQFTTTRSTYL